MSRRQHWETVAIIVVTVLIYSLILYLISCGEGGGPSPPGVPHVLTWTQPPEWDDGSPMDVYLDIERYDIYCSENALFTYNNIVASVSGHTVDNVIDYFDLDKLPPTDNCIFLSVRSVSIHGVKSEFAPPIAWNDGW